MDDRHILQLLWNRSEQAITALANRFGKRLYRLAMNILSNPQDAEESVSDTYLALWNAIPPAQPDPLEGYVYRTGRNTALNRLRHLTAQSRNCRYDLSLDELSDILPGGTLEETLDAKLLGQAIDRFLDSIPKESRVVFLRRYWFGDSMKELSREWRLSENVLSVRLYCIRSQLKDYLYKEGFFYEA